MNEVQLERVSGAVHEAYRAYLKATGDETLLAWPYLPHRQQVEERERVREIVSNCRLDPDGIHEAWMARKLEAGWIRGKHKDSQRKTHPYIVPFLELPLQQKAKLEIYHRMATSLAEHCRHNA